MTSLPRVQFPVWTGPIIDQAMETSDSVAKFCEVCSKLDTQRLAHPFHLCHNESLHCSEAPIERGHVGGYLALGSIDEIKSRRSTCDICKLIAGCLDKEPSDLTGECRITETQKFCSFKLPRNVKAGDPSITHFHLTEASVIFDTSMVDQFQGPSLPWEVKTRSIRAAHYILNLQTKARSCHEPSDSTSVTLQTEQEFLDTIGGRYVGMQVNIQLIQAWLHECECEHGKDCVPAMQLLVERYKEPTFVVDVIESCLVDTPSQCRYVALSYVWGTASVFKHISENTQDLRKTGSLLSLPIPATIRDAMTLVHAIGERYLWIDSLCIIQDDLKMQQTEIMRMGSIYSRALFTIIAAAGNHANSGLPGVGPGSREQVQKILKLANCELLTVIDIRNTPSGIDDTIWAQRAWTFQERVLSNRVLVFSESQVYWSCRAASHSEERALEEVRDLDPHHPSFPQKPISDCLSWKSLPPLEYCDLYDNLLYNYRQRRLTYQTDILNAFNGISEILAALQNDTFFWGLPESLFSYAMIWELTGHSSRNYIKVPVFESGGSKEMTPIPSWSWAAWLGQDSTHLRDLFDGENNTVQPLIQFSIVDSKRQLVTIKERLWQDQPGDRVRALWQDTQPHQFQSLPQHSLLKIGHLHFWTSLATVKAIRRWDLGARGMDYVLFPSSDFQPNPNGTHDRSEIVHQDFIVVAARGRALILLAVEWKDGIAYRVGKAEVKEAQWVLVENRQWRSITLG